MFLCGYGDKGRRLKYWVHLSCWISPCHGLFLLDTHFETYKPFTSLIFQFFSGWGKLKIIETVDTESMDMGA
jgi:hypothetical protein